ncbi:MAG: hypothetical protein Q9221_008666 [Calogaya cf. arnoldii]
MRFQNTLLVLATVFTMGTSALNIPREAVPEPQCSGGSYRDMDRAKAVAACEANCGSCVTFQNQDYWYSVCQCEKSADELCDHLYTVSARQFSGPQERGKAHRHRRAVQTNPTVEPELPIYEFPVPPPQAQQLQSFLQTYLDPGVSVRKKVQRRLLAKERKRLQTFIEDIKIARAGIADSLAISTMFCTIKLPAHMASVGRVVEAREPHLPRLGRDQSLAAVTSLVNQIQHHAMVDDGPMQSQSMHTRHELSANRLQLQKLTSLLTSRKVQRRGRLTRAMSEQDESCGTEVYDEDSVGQRDTSNQQDLVFDAVDIFYDCVSQFSEDCAREYHDQGIFSTSTSPFSYFESGQSYYGEQYTTNNHIGEIATAVAVIELPCTSTHRLQRYHLIYAETARLWKRVTVSVLIKRAPQCGSSASKANSIVESCAFNILPLYLYDQLPALLRSTSLFGTVTEVSLSVGEYAPGCYTINTPSVVVAEDLEESGKSDEEKMLQGIDHMGCHQYLESEVIVKKLIKSSSFLVQVEGQTYIERKMPFSGAAPPGADGVKDFYEHLRMVYLLRDSDSVVEFFGVVLDDTRSHLNYGRTTYLGL